MNIISKKAREALAKYSHQVIFFIFSVPYLLIMCQSIHSLSNQGAFLSFVPEKWGI